MQLTTSRTNLSQVNTSLLPNDFSKIARSLEQKNQAASLHPFINFRGQFSVGEFLFPIQKFSLREKGDCVFIENFPTDSFPKIEIILEEKNSIYEVKEFGVRPSDNKVQAEILHTRFFLLTADAKKCSLHFRDIDFKSLNFSFSDMFLEERKQLLFRAKLFRKLGFIERVFEKTKFVVPEFISSNEAGQIEVLFRGLAEGEFTNPSNSSVTIYNYKISKYDLENNSLFSKREFSLEFDENFFILGRFFEVGKVIVKVKKASIANPRKIRDVKEKEVIDELRLNVFDSQIRYIFEKYNNTERLSKNKQKLEHFKNYLRKEEPEFLVNLLDEPLAEVTNKAAIEIVTGWMQFYDFPDRYTVGEPLLEENQWRVPIWLTYPNNKGVWLEDAFVNFRNGAIKLSSSAKELREKGKRKAKEIFSVV